MRRLCNDWLENGNKSSTSGGNMRAPLKNVLRSMIVQARSKLTEEMVLESFVSLWPSASMHSRPDFAPKARPAC